MNYKDLKIKLLSYNKTRIDFPFDDVTAVFKVFDKMFALVALDSHPLRITLKCKPEDAEALRSLYKSITPGYHMDKRHWNTVIPDNSIPPEVLDEMIEDSYWLVVRGLKKSEREQLKD